MNSGKTPVKRRFEARRIDLFTSAFKIDDVHRIGRGKALARYADKLKALGTHIRAARAGTDPLLHIGNAQRVFPRKDKAGKLVQNSA